MNGTCPVSTGGGPIRFCIKNVIVAVQFDQIPIMGAGIVRAVHDVAFQSDRSRENHKRVRKIDAGPFFVGQELISSSSIVHILIFIVITFAFDCRISGGGGLNALI